MIIEAKPLHKKKKRLLRQQTLLTQRPSGDRLSSILEVPSSNPIGLLVGGSTWFKYSLSRFGLDWLNEYNLLFFGISAAISNGVIASNGA